MNEGEQHVANRHAHDPGPAPGVDPGVYMARCAPPAPLVEGVGDGVEGERKKSACSFLARRDRAEFDQSFTVLLALDERLRSLLEPAEATPEQIEEQNACEHGQKRGASFSIQVEQIPPTPVDELECDQETDRGECCSQCLGAPFSAIRVGG